MCESHDFIIMFSLHMKELTYNWHTNHISAISQHEMSFHIKGHPTRKLQEEERKLSMLAFMFHKNQHNSIESETMTTTFSNVAHKY